ncbi:MAG TPA: hypothetical protein VLM37_06155 [Fibrobacteraceae bacterium]|nr:hypothetical protein [Fibrobacteraceae bacterium]
MQNLPELAVTWSIGLLAIIVSLNARGTLRIALSWVLTAAIVSLCVFASVMHVSELKQRFLDGASAETPLVASKPISPSRGMGSLGKMEGSQTDERIAENYIQQAQRIVGSALGCAGAISSFDARSLSTLPDEQYEQEQSRALSLRNQSSSISRQVKALHSPQSLSWLQNDFDKAAENLRLAGWAVHAYFGAENSDEERDLQDQFQRNARLAQSSFRNIQQELLRQH